ncbi:Sortilin [Thelohanellus kitauei]|uniref:Sortilin n=1 Tax=Thelohanellus kitauei TaxID=669202 RepID=A0A0C2MGS6_THEKT|nr:Sortilin [Thelohanellus kitauei]
MGFKDGESDCGNKKSGVEWDFKCSDDLITNTFPEKWIVKFEGKYHGKCLINRRTFVSFDGGKRWKMLNSKVENLTIFKSSGFMLGTEKEPGRIWYSYDEGWTWYKKYVFAQNFIYITSLESPNSNVIAAINYKESKNIYTFFTFDFSSILSSLFWMIDRECTEEDFEIWYVYRNFGNCFQGSEISYLKKNAMVICTDKRSQIMATIKPCPCSLEDFHWYHNFYHSKPNYYSQENLCVFETYSSFSLPVKACRDDGTALNKLDG